MSFPVADSGTIRFGAFEVDLCSCELRKDGVKVKLEGQPFQVLVVLLERPGQLVTREELQAQLWTDETFVDFEQGINAAVKRLRVALEDSADQPRFVETLPRRGYRFIAHIENRAKSSVLKEENQMGPISPDGRMDAEGAQSPVSRSATPLRRPILVALAATAFALLLLALTLATWRDRHPRPAAADMTAIAVLPLQNLTGDPEQEYFVDAMTEALTTELGKISDLRVVSRTSAMAFKDARKPLPEIARQLGVHVVLEGAVARNGDHLRVTARLMHASQERTLWAASYERELRDIANLQSEIVRIVADEIKVKLLGIELRRQVPPVKEKPATSNEAGLIPLAAIAL